MTRHVREGRTLLLIDKPETPKLLTPVSGTWNTARCRGAYKYAIISCLSEKKHPVGDENDRPLINRIQTRLLLFGKRSATSFRVAAQTTGVNVYRNRGSFELHTTTAWT
jgi:hypothetical protein